jgi:hypothetical protein
MFVVDRSDHQVALFRSVLRAEDDVLRFPERLRFDKVDAVFRFVAFAFPRIELEFHNADLTNAPALRASRAVLTRVHALGQISRLKESICSTSVCLSRCNETAVRISNATLGGRFALRGCVLN